MDSDHRPLLSNSFMERLWALRELAFRLSRKRELRGTAAGQDPEFETHRAYEPGEDPRYIDWNAYARLEKLLLKVYVTDEDTQVDILVDTSRSMHHPDTGKLSLAARLAAAFGYLALAARHKLLLGAFAERVLAVRGPLSSLGQFPQVIDFLSDPPRGRDTDLGLSLVEFLAATRGRSLVLVISDLLQEGDVMRDIDRVLFRKADIQIIHVLDDDEIEPGLRGECSAADVESDRLLNLSVGFDVLSAFRALVGEYLSGIEEGCRRRAIPYLRARTSQPFEDLVIRHLLGKAGRP